ncbi:MAG: hypothetical protein ABH807_00185 [Candidatus Shapirobacteria bacterium]
MRYRKYWRKNTTENHKNMILLLPDLLSARSVTVILPQKNTKSFTQKPEEKFGTPTIGV